MTLARLFSPCPLWHRSTDRICRYENARIVFECALCGRDASEALADQRRAEPLDGPVMTRRPLSAGEKVTQFPTVVKRA